MSKTKRQVLLKLKTKARLALQNVALVGIASSANSPSAAYELAYLETGDVGKSQSCRFLAMVKRDYGKKEFDSLVSSVVSNRPQPKRQPGKSKGKRTMTDKKVRPIESSSEEERVVMIPLKHITYRAAITGVFSRVRVIQTFENDAHKSVEAVYVFPLPDEASVIDCQMKIGSRKIASKLKESEVAKAEYNQAIDDGHHAVLMEQERPNIFTMNIGGIEPGEKIDVEVTYVQRVPWQRGGRFCVPLVVAPRFIYGNSIEESSGGGWSSDTDEVPDASRINPKVVREGVPYDADISVSLSAGFRTKVSSPSHSSMVEEVVVKKADSIEVKTGNISADRDFILCYEPKSKVPEVALHGFKQDDETYCLASIIPPEDVSVSASEIVMLLDISGSMQGGKIVGLRTIAKKVLDNLKSQGIGHRVCVMVFNQNSRVICPMGEITDEMISTISGIEASGMTCLGPALTDAFSQFTDPELSKNILLITDGQTTSLNYIGNDARIIAAGVDTAVNDTALKELTRKTGGAVEWFYPGEDFSRVANSLVGMLSGPVLCDISIDNGEAFGISDVFYGRPAAIAVKLTKEKDTFIITGIEPGTNIENGWVVGPKFIECDFAPQIWAREFIRKNQNREDQISVSLKYGVICSYTSFVAVSEKEIAGQKPERVEIPVNLPHGWDFDSVFGGGFAIGNGQFFGTPITMSMSYLMSGGQNLCASSLDSMMLCNSMDRGFDNDPFSGVNDFLPNMFDNIRFRLNSVDCLDRLIAIFIAAVEGKQEEAIVAFKSLSWTPEEIKTWSDEKRTIAHYFANKLAIYHMASEKDIMNALSSADHSSGGPAAWYEAIRRDCGYGYDMGIVVPNDCDGAGYLKWILGKSGRPTGDWIDVPLG